MSNGQPTPPPSNTRELRSSNLHKIATLSTQAVFNDIERKIPQVTEFTELVYEDIPPEEGALICDSLADSSVVEEASARVHFNSFTKTLWVRIMPTELHDVHQRWCNYASRKWDSQGLLNPTESKLLDIGTGTRFRGFIGQRYLHSSKEPDVFIRPDTTPMPRIVIESGWSESWPRLQADKNLWLNGTNDVCLVMLLKWSKLTGNRASGTLELWRRNAAGGLISCQKNIFPVPVAPGADMIHITKLDVFGQHMVAGQNPNAVLPLQLSDLRDFARERMASMGLTPA
ncbi:hypothetical protein Asppvi_002564 [Aspergillus pseudoviridinutans]|uniref:Uncharacterized protein n=1 Tax=Aspergillus pseudoviridinutans TaxID=1517512 RepID=A0A9P3B5A7_9EURO|nr:uncharacterized protein Asppvi_002564 [Aspergillus pseudoviridinutans]GIJ83734.1 hypothetical protein Asppvi_002564 [Aspergillus pseudoviridinutans]